MIQININEIKKHFFMYLHLKAKPKKRILGSGKASITVSPDCFEPWPEEYMDLFYGSGKASKVS